MPLLGCIADDLAGATDLAGALVREGMTAVQVIGTPEEPLPAADAVVVSPVFRPATVREAAAAALAACEALLAAGCRQLLLRHGPGPEAGFGPVADALAQRLGTGFAPVCPAAPAVGQTVYQGHLFAGAALAGADANLVRALGAGTDGAVGLVPFATVEGGSAAIRRALTGLKEGGRRYAVVDALTDGHLRAIAEAATGQALLVGGAGLASGLPETFRRAGLLPARDDAGALPPPRGPGLVLAGSLTRATLAQIGFARDRMPTLELDPLETPDAAALARQALDWAEGRLGEGPVLIAASAPPDRVAALQARIGPDRAGALVEAALADIAAALVARGVGRLLVAGGATAGAVVSRLGARALHVGWEIDPGVPWTFAAPAGPHLALKPGPLGARDLFLKAFET